MNKLKEKVLQADFAKIGRRFLIAVIVFAVIGGVISGITLKTQIGDMANVYQNRKQILQDEKSTKQTVNTKEQKTKDEKDHLDKKEILKTYITPVSTGQKVILAVVGLVGVAFAVIYWLLVAAWLYKEAKRANMQYGIWFLAGLIGNLAAVVIFITVRSCIRVQCFHCKSWQKKTDYCSECGASMQMICPSCGEKVNREDHFCGACGKKMQN